jgi:hypothetical protein
MIEERFIDRLLGKPNGNGPPGRPRCRWEEYKNGSSRSVMATHGLD